MSATFSRELATRKKPAWESTQYWRRMTDPAGCFKVLLTDSSHDSLIEPRGKAACHIQLRCSVAFFRHVRWHGGVDKHGLGQISDVSLQMAVRESANAPCLSHRASKGWCGNLCSRLAATEAPTWQQEMGNFISA